MIPEMYDILKDDEDEDADIQKAFAIQQEADKMDLEKKTLESKARVAESISHMLDSMLNAGTNPSSSSITKLIDTVADIGKDINGPPNSNT